MSIQNSAGPAADPWQEAAARPTTDGREAAHYGKTYNLLNSTVTIEPGLRGPLARVVRRDGVEYAGPLTEATIEALAEVSYGWD